MDIGNCKRRKKRLSHVVKLAKIKFILRVLNEL